MKYTIIALLSVLLFSCNQSTTFKKQKNDTIKTAALFMDARSGYIVGSVVLKIRKDSTRIDTLTSRVYQSRDSSYLVIQYLDRVDSTGKVMKDTLGNVLKYGAWVPIADSFVLQDYNKKY